MAAVRDKGKKIIAKKAQALGKLSIQYVPVGSIKPNPYNPNRQGEHEFELLQRSIREDGFTQPIIAQEATREIVDGEHRWRAAQALGYTEVPVVFVDMDPAQMRIATLRHNRARGSEEVELTSQVLKDLQTLGALEWAQDSLMLDDVEINRLLEDVSVPDALAADEYSQAWLPGKGGDGGGVSQEANVTVSSDGITSVAVGTAAAIDALRAREVAVKAAKTEEEKTMALSSRDVFRVTAFFSGEQAEVVRRVLGRQPADRIYELCLKAQ